MSANQRTNVYDDLVDLLADGADRKRLFSFRLSPAKQARLDHLLDLNRNAGLSDKDAAELDAYAQFEHVVRLLKARTLQKRAS